MRICQDTTKTIDQRDLQTSLIHNRGNILYTEQLKPKELAK